MTNMQEKAGHAGPEGLIFLPKDEAISRFLALEGDPAALVSEIIATGSERDIEYLKFSFLQSRGIDKISDELDDDEVTAEIDKRFHFYSALTTASEVLELDQAV